MDITAALIGEIVWAVGIIGWYVIRYPFERRARRVRVVSRERTPSEAIGLGAALFGLAIFPALYLVTGFPEAANRGAAWWSVVVGALVFGLALYVFRRSHKDLGRNWSITLELRDQHKLVRSGVYALIRHPMYTSFMLMGLGQAFLLPNWAAGLAGLVGFAVLFALRVGKEEDMMLRAFGPEYRDYMSGTKRIIPYLY